MNIIKRRFCMVCGYEVAIVILNHSKEKLKEEYKNYSNPTCVRCGNKKRFIAYSWDGDKANCNEQLEKFKDDLLKNPFCNYDKACEYRNIEKHAAILRKESVAKNSASYAVKDSTPNIPKCPTCGSTDIKDISTLNRMVSVGAFGLASDKIGKTKECKNCGYKW